MTKSFDTHSIGNDAFLHFPDDPLGEVFTQMSPKSFMGEHNVRFVCHRWNNYINKNIKSMPNHTKKSLMARCNSKQDSLDIFKDNALRDSLSFDEWLFYASFNDEVVEAISTSLSPAEVHGLCKYNPQLALRCLNSPTLLLSKFALAGDHIEVARELFNNPEVMEPIQLFDLIKLCKHDEIFQLVSKIPRLITILEPKIHFLAECSETITRWAFGNTAILKSRISQLLESIAKYEDLCHALLDNQELSNCLQGAYLAVLASHHHSVAKRILDSKEMSERMNLEDKFSLFLHNPSLTEYWLKIPEFMQRDENGNRLFLYFIKNITILTCVKNDTNYWQMLPADIQAEVLEMERIYSLPNIVTMLQQNTSVQTVINTINDPNFPLESIEYLSIKKLLKCKDGLTCAMAIVDCPRLRLSLSSKSLLNLALASKSAGLFILKNKELLDKFSNSELIKLMEHCFEYALIIFNENSTKALKLNVIVEKSTERLLYLTLLKYPAICKMAANTNLYYALLNMFGYAKPLGISNFKSRLDIVEQIMEIINKQLDAHICDKTEENNQSNSDTSKENKKQRCLL